MDENLKFFEKFLYEAPGEDPPDMPDLPSATGPPDAGGGDLPDMPDLGGGDGGDFGGFDNEDNAGDGEEQGQNLELDEKISAIMNMNLYQRYLALLNTIDGQLSMIKGNSDVLYTLSPESIEIIGDLKKLAENVRLYIKNNFLHANYSVNLLFFNRCLNLLKLLNDQFGGNIQKGIKSMK